VSGLTAGAAVRAAGHTVVPVWRDWLHAGRSGRGAWAAGGREPVAVAVRDARGARALDMNGDPVSLEALLAEVDGLAAALGDGKGEGR
jgi:hypothetical protein